MRTENFIDKITVYLYWMRTILNKEWTQSTQNFINIVHENLILLFLFISIECKPGVFKSTIQMATWKWSSLKIQRTLRANNNRAGDLCLMENVMAFYCLFGNSILISKRTKHVFHNIRNTMNIIKKKMFRLMPKNIDRAQYNFPFVTQTARLCIWHCEVLNCVLGM